MKNKILILGSARHGKDTLAEMINKYTGLNFESSSIAAVRIFIFDLLKEKYSYKSLVDCFNDRVNHRKEWHDLICDYNINDKARLARDILTTSSVYVGMRSDEELKECNKQGIFKYVIGVFDSRKPLEAEESFDIDFWSSCDFVIPNNGTLKELNDKVFKICKLIKSKK